MKKQMLAVAIACNSLLFTAGLSGCGPTGSTAPAVEVEASPSDVSGQPSEAPPKLDPAVEASVQVLAEAGVQVVRKGDDVIELNFGETAATDSLADAATGFPAVVKVTIRQSELSDDGWSKLGQLKQLEQIDIRDCAVNNSQFLTLTRDLPQLKALRLSGKSGLTVVDDAGLANLGKCSKLKVFAADGLWVGSEGLQHLLPCIEISELYLAGTLVDDAAVEVVANFPKISKLRLAKTSVSAQGLEFLTRLPIVEVDLSECTQVLDAAMPVIAKMKGLKRLNLWRDSISNSGVAELAPLTDLEWLNLDNTHMGDDALPHLSGMSKLTFLHLGSTAVTNAGMPALLPLKSLRDLKVTRTAVTEEGVKSLREALPELAIQIKYVEGE